LLLEKGIFWNYLWAHDTNPPCSENKTLAGVSIDCGQIQKHFEGLKNS
jgi:hypothetical protein